MDKYSKTYNRRVSFEYRGAPGSKVFLSGSFNNWHPTQYMMSDSGGNGFFRTDIELPGGKHEYKFVVNGIWHVDPNCGQKVPNEYGTYNSVVNV